jgi:hypothetical protein
MNNTEAVVRSAGVSPIAFLSLAIDDVWIVLGLRAQRYI